MQQPLQVRRRGGDVGAGAQAGWLGERAQPDGLLSEGVTIASCLIALPAPSARVKLTSPAGGGSCS
ncbi:MAG: hypothetical protein ACKO8I_14830, partial [Cyanobacteriota bacterium]